MKKPLISFLAGFTVIFLMALTTDQIIQKVYDSSNTALRVNLVAGGGGSGNAPTGCTNTNGDPITCPSYYGGIPWASMNTNFVDAMNAPVAGTMATYVGSATTTGGDSAWGQVTAFQLNNTTGAGAAIGSWMNSAATGTTNTSYIYGSMSEAYNFGSGVGNVLYGVYGVLTNSGSQSVAGTGFSGFVVSGGTYSELYAFAGDASFAGKSPSTRAATFYSPSMGSGANDYAIYIVGGKNYLGTGITSFGANAAISSVEGTATSGSAGSDILYADSTAHRFTMTNNNGTAIAVAGFITGTASITPGTITASQCADSGTTITVTGAVANDPCSLGPPAAGAGTHISATCYISGASTATVRFCNSNTSNQTGTTGTYRATVVH